ncbi:UBX domain-containing protein 11-like [Symsagittifera roscoffensis]|uniref:UBX domain-containing protein 11-like n=1 Tax=Symsagittifera roscoffensis TaxID=84072 RepID=UPI00307B9092
MSSPMSVLKPHKRFQPTPRRSSDDPFKLPELSERSRRLYGRNYHSGAEAFNFASMNSSNDVEMPNLLCDYTTVDIENRQNTPDNLDRFIADFVHKDGQNSRKNSKASPRNKVSPRNKLTGAGYSPSAPDVALMTSMASRLRQVEGQLQEYSREIIEKDLKIKQLQERLNQSELELNKVNEVYSKTNVGVVQKRCEELQKQVDEMESFLEDYGMIWVGDSNNAKYNSRESLNEDDGDTGEDWIPGESVDIVDRVPFNELIKGVKDLNVLVGEGIARVSQTKTGATFKIPDPINLEFYTDGFILFDGPFRMYSDDFSKEFIRDILDGFFPSELRERYPDGIPFAVKDKRDVMFLEKESPKQSFPGSGHKLLQELESRVVRSGSAHGNKGESSKEFTRKLPLSVVKNGKVIDIRNDIEAQLTQNDNANDGSSNKESSDNRSGVSVLATKFMKEVYKLDPKGEDTSKVDPEILKKVSTLRIRSAAGDNFYIAKMYHDETIGDIRNYIHAMMSDAKVYDLEIITTYPRKVVHSDNTQTIADAGLVPTAVLVLKEPKN